MEVRLTDDASVVLAQAAAFLATDPVAHNLVLTLLHQRAAAAAPEAGRYGWVADGGSVVGVSFQSPLTFFATVTPMPMRAVDALVEALADAAPDLVGVNGDATTTARFAGAWGTRLRAPATPVEGQRLYRLEHLSPAARPPGSPRRATLDDAALLERFNGEFHADTGSPPAMAMTAETMLAGRELWLWEDPDPVCMVGRTNPIEGVARVGPVYTPAAVRGRGYAGALTSHATQAILDEGATPILYTQLSNPTSNALYQRLGYSPVGEITRYAFS